MKRWTWILLVFAFLTMGHKAWSQIAVSGNVYEQDSITPIEMASVTFSGISELGDTLIYQLTTDTIGHFSDSLVAGIYQVWASAEGYTTTYLTDSLLIEEDQSSDSLIFVLYELFHPVQYVEARLFTNDLVRLCWSMNDSLPQGDSVKMTRSFQYYDLFRSRFEEEPVLMASHLTDTVFMDMN